MEFMFYIKVFRKSVRSKTDNKAFERYEGVKNVE